MASHSFPYRISLYACRVFTRIWNRLECTGLENLPTTGACLVASNHASHLDPPCIGSACTTRFLDYVARDSLLEIPGIGWWLKKVRLIPVNRDRGDLPAMKAILRALGEGKAVVVFPEGTRSRDGQIQDGKPGVGFIAMKSQAPVIPIFIDGSFRAMPPGRNLIWPTKIRVTIGKPISAEEFAALGAGKDAYESAGKLIMDRIRSLAGAKGSSD